VFPDPVPISVSGLGFGRTSGACYDAEATGDASRQRFPSRKGTGQMSSSTHLTLAICAGLLFLPTGCTQADRQVSPGSAVEEAAKDAEIVEEYWPNGQLRLRKGVVRDPDGTLVNHGTYTRWYQNGQKEYEAVFVLGKKQGIARRWHPNGRQWMEERYDHGQRHGVSFAWDENGRKRKEEQYFDGKPHGTWTVWDKNGRIEWQGSFEHGNPKP
jgi:hypothetical protein